MPLTDNQIKDLLDSNPSKSLLDSAKLVESQLRVFTEEMSESEIATEMYWADLDKRMHVRSAKKYKRIKDFMRFPLPIVQFSDSISTDFYKIFEGKNRNFGFNSDRTNDGVIRDWIEENPPEKWIQENAKEVLKSKPSSMVVLDIDEKGKPYPLLVDLDRLVEAKFKDKTQLEYILFVHSLVHDGAGKHTATKYAFYDDTSYRVYEKQLNTDAFTLVTSETHRLGRCPARAFIPNPSNSKNKFKRKAAFSSALSLLEDWTLFDVYRNFVDHYAPFPVTEAAAKQCSNPDCIKGMVEEEVVVDAKEGTTRMHRSKCQVCQGGDDGTHIMPGTHIGIDMATNKEDQDGRGLFRMIFPDVENMKYVPQKLDELKLEIRYSIVGVNTSYNPKAFNEMQVKSSFDGMETIFLRNKRDLDELYIWIVENAATLMLGEMDIDVIANFGTEYHLLPEDDLQTRYKVAKEAGMPLEYIQAIYQQLIETKYSGNPAKVERELLIMELDPLPLYSAKEVIDMAESGLVDKRALNLKINFINFIHRFENTNGNIVMFGSNLERHKRIEIITQILNTYNDEQLSKMQPLREDGAGVGEPK